MKKFLNMLADQDFRDLFGTREKVLRNQERMKQNKRNFLSE